MDVVPSRLPIAQALDVLDRNQRLRGVAQDVGNQVVFAGDFALLIGRVVQHMAVHISENIVAHPTHHFEMAAGEHGSQYALQ